MNVTQHHYTTLCVNIIYRDENFPRNSADFNSLGIDLVNRPDPLRYFYTNIGGVGGLYSP